MVLWIQVSIYEYCSFQILITSCTFSWGCSFLQCKLILPSQTIYWLETKKTKNICLTCITQFFLSFLFLPASLISAINILDHWNENVITDSCYYLFPLIVSGSSQRSVYTGKELEYAFFVHSLCVLGKVLIYTNGRQLFPIKVRKRKGTVLNCF